MSLKKHLSSLLAAAMIAAVPGVALVASPASAAEQAAPTAAAPAPEAAAMPSAATPAPATMVSRETVANPYGLDALWKQGDFVARGTLIILVIMSMGSWYILVIKLFEQYKLLQQAKNMQKTFWSAGSIEKARGR